MKSANPVIKVGVAVLICLTVPSLAEEAAPVVSWPDCVTMASQQNPDLLSARQSLLSLEAQYYESFNGYFPHINFSSSYRDADAISTNDQWHAQADISMNLFNSETNANIRLALASLNQSAASLKLASSNLRYSLRQAFANLLYAQENIRVAERILEVRSNNAKMVTLKYESGRESKGNSLRAKAELRQAQADVAASRRNLRSAQQELNRQLGRDEFGVIIATGSLDVPSPPEIPNRWEVPQQHPQLLQILATRDISLASLQAARSPLWPTLSAAYARTSAGPSFFPQESYGWSASALLSYRLLGSGLTSTYYSSKAARRNLDKVEEDLRSVRNQIRSTLESNWASFANSVDQVAVQKQFLEAVRQRNDESSIRYASGLTSFEDWELAVADLVNYEKGMIQAERDTTLSQANFERATGKLLEE